MESTPSPLPAPLPVLDRWFTKRIPDLLFVICLGFAFVTAVRVTHSLQWPCEGDFWRDIASARTIVDGHYGSDPAYRGEFLWYNPLVPALVAMISKLLGTSLGLTYARAGAYLNLVTPIGFYLLARQVFAPLGRMTALFSGLAFLFLGDGRSDSLTSNATYSPWLWAENFAQGLLYLALYVLLRDRSRRRASLALAVGVLLGLAMMAQTTPALLGGVLVTLVMLADALEGGRPVIPVLLRWLGIGVLAVLCTLPFTYPIAAHYHFRVLNWAGIVWNQADLTLDGVWPFLHRQLSLRMLVAAVGFLLLLFPRTVHRHSDLLPALESPARRLLLFWVLTTTCLLIHNYVADYALARGRFLPRIVPAWHYVVYLKAAESLLFGYASTQLLRLLLGLIRPALKMNGRWHTRRVEQMASLFLVGGLLAVTLPRYPHSADLHENQQLAKWYARWSDRFALQQFIEQHTAKGDVILTDFVYAHFSVVPAGRKVVAMAGVFANPYVDPAPRLRDFRLLYESLVNKNTEVFLSVAKKYDVRWVVIPPQGFIDFVRPQIAGVLADPFPFLKLAATFPRPAPDADDTEKCLDGDESHCVLRAGSVQIYQVVFPPENGGG